MVEKFNLEQNEVIKEKPALTMYLLRHGQSEKDKTKANRGLTEKGQEQVREAMNNIIRNTIKENNPDFSEWDNPEKLKQEIQKIASEIEFHLRDSDTDRTIQQVILEYNILKEYGIDDKNIYLPKPVLEYDQNIAPEKEKTAGPGIAKRLKGVQGLDQNPEFRKKLGSPEYKKMVGATGALMAWAKSPEDTIPEDVEKPSAMKERYQKDIEKAEKVIKRLMRDYEKKVIVIANSHASIATLAAGQELEIPVDELLNKSGEMPEAQGLKYDFYKGDKKHKAKVFGKDIKESISNIDAKRIDVG